MAVLVATHSGPFHADDVMAVALVRVFHDADAEVIRTRDSGRIAAADIVVDVGGIYDPPAGRFDHHQAAYTGPLSAAGMVLRWLTDEGRIDPGLSAELSAGAMEYLDDVDNGRRPPDAAVPCFPRIVEALNQPAESEDEFDRAFYGAVGFAAAWLHGVAAGHRRVLAAGAEVRAAMAAAEAAGSNLLEFERYIKWKEPYFDAGGEEHRTELVLFPGTDGSWRVVCIPPERGSFAQKRSLPEPWAGLTGDTLAAKTGVPGSVFCHKNRFIAVFEDKAQALEALERGGMLT
ncbi:MAG: uncharacterized UPF0160 family protein [Myxococcota bacterium]